MNRVTNQYPFDEAWEKEIKKLPKDELVKMIRKAQTGTSIRKMVEIETINQAENQVEGIINDFTDGISTKEETLELLGEYTGRLMGLFWVNAKRHIRENPELLK